MSEDLTQNEFTVSNIENNIDTRGVWRTYIDTWKKCFSFKGRANRTEYFLFYGLNSLLFIPAFLGLFTLIFFISHKSPKIAEALVAFLPLFIFFYLIIKGGYFILLKIKKIPIENSFNKRYLFVNLATSTMLSILSVHSFLAAIALIVLYCLPSVVAFSILARRFHDRNKSLLKTFIKMLVIFIGFVGIGLLLSFLDPQSKFLFIRKIIFILAGFFLIFLSFLYFWIIPLLKGSPSDNKYGPRTPTPKKYVSIIAGILIFTQIFGIILVITIGGYVGYTQAMSRYQSEQIAKEVVQVAVLSMKNPYLKPSDIQIKGIEVLQIGQGNVLFSLENEKVKEIFIQSGYVQCQEKGSNCLFMMPK